MQVKDELLFDTYMISSHREHTMYVHYRILFITQFETSMIFKSAQNESKNLKVT